MVFNPSAIWSWYQARPKWAKWILFVFVILAIVVAAGAAYLLAGGILGRITGKGPDPLQTGKDAAEEHFRDGYDDAVRRDEEAAADIGRERDERNGLKEEREDAAEENKKLHEKVDGADSIADVDAVLRSPRSRR